MANIDYLASGYNIYKGDPLYDGRDPGFTSGHVFTLDYRRGYQTGDRRYFVPDGVSMQS